MYTSKAQTQKVNTIQRLKHSNNSEFLKLFNSKSSNKQTSNKATANTT